MFIIDLVNVPASQGSSTGLKRAKVKNKHPPALITNASGQYLSNQDTPATYVTTSLY